MTASSPSIVIIMPWWELRDQTLALGEGVGEKPCRLSVYSGQNPRPKKTQNWAIPEAAYGKTELCAKQQGSRVHVCPFIHPSIHSTIYPSIQQNLSKYISCAWHSV